MHQHPWPYPRRTAPAHPPPLPSLAPLTPHPHTTHAQNTTRTTCNPTQHGKPRKPRFPRRGSRDGLGCSDVLVGPPAPGSNQALQTPVLAHNEDEDVAFHGYTYLLIGRTVGR